MKAMVCLICVPAFKCQPIGYEDDTVEGKRKEQAFISSERPYIIRGRRFKFGGNKPLKLVNYQLPPPPRLQRVNPRQAKRPGAIPIRKRNDFDSTAHGGRNNQRCDSAAKRTARAREAKAALPEDEETASTPIPARGKRTPAGPPMREGMERGAAAAGADEDGWIWSSGRRCSARRRRDGAQIWWKWSDGERPLGIRLYESEAGFFFRTGGPKSPPTCSGLLDRFDRLPDKTIKFK